MLTDYILNFPSGSLLTGELLQKMYEYPKDLINYIFADYSEGVISGLNVNYTEQKLTLSKGIYKHNSSLYILEKETIIAENLNFEGYEWYAILEEENVSKTNNITLKHLNVKVKNLNKETYLQLKNDNLLLFSFRYEPRFPIYGDDILEGAYNLLDYKHAYPGEEPTFMPQVFRLVFNKLSAKSVKHPLDYIIISEILSKGVISCELMRVYIKSSNRYIPNKENRLELMKTFWESISDEVSNSSRIDNPVQRKRENDSCLF